MITKMLKRKIKDLNFVKIMVEMDVKTKENKGIAWVSSNDILTLNQLIKLHYHVSYNSFNFNFFYLDLRQLQVNHFHVGLCL